VALAGDDDDSEALIARQARRWHFKLPTGADRNEHDAVRASASSSTSAKGFCRRAPFPETPPRLVVLAIEVHAGREPADALRCLSR
jgi:hypothetical protein